MILGNVCGGIPVCRVSMRRSIRVVSVSGGASLMAAVVDRVFLKRMLSIKVSSLKRGYVLWNSFSKRILVEWGVIV